MPNLRRAARIVATPRERSSIGAGDPFQKVVFQIAPMLAEELWHRSGAETAAPTFDPAALAGSFLQGHRVIPLDEGGCRRGGT
jgi:leucyl-tRNA synthetase